MTAKTDAHPTRFDSVANAKKNWSSHAAREVSEVSQTDNSVWNYCPCTLQLENVWTANISYFVIVIRPFTKLCMLFIWKLPSALGSIPPSQKKSWCHPCVHGRASQVKSAWGQCCNKLKKQIHIKKCWRSRPQRKILQRSPRKQNW